MNRVVKVLLALVVVVGLGAGGFAVFEQSEQGEVAKKGERACGTLDTPEAGVTVPAGVTLPAGLKLLKVATQGKTTLLVTSTEGARQDVVKVRDQVVGQLAELGWTQTGTDQEPGYEAEAQFGGKVDGSLRVRPLCQDRLEVRLTIRG